MAALSEKALELLRGKNFAYVATVNRDGSPQVTPVWIDTDGTNVLFRPIRPTSVTLALYYNPDRLAPVNQSGNQVIFVSFNDVPGSGFGINAVQTDWNVLATKNTGEALPATVFSASGVRVSDLASVAGAGVNGASGGINFSANPGGAAHRRRAERNPVERPFDTQRAVVRWSSACVTPRGEPSTL